jgi:hypothetical protein
MFILQGEIEVMLEMIKLPIFTVKQESFYTSHIINMKVNCYVLFISPSLIFLAHLSTKGA